MSRKPRQTGNPRCRACACTNSSSRSAWFEFSLTTACACALVAKVSMRQNRSPGGNSVTFRSAKGFTKKPCCADAGEDRINNPRINAAKSLRSISQPSGAGGAVARACGPVRNPFAQCVLSRRGTATSWPQSAPSRPGDPVETGESLQASVRIGSVAGWPQSHLRSDLALCGLSMLRRLTMCSNS